MSEYYEFTVCLKNESDKDVFVQQMASDVKILDSKIPARTCNNYNDDSNRYIKYKLTHEEVKELEKDSRIHSIYQRIPGGKRRSLVFDKEHLFRLEKIAIKDNTSQIQNSLSYTGDEFASVSLPSTTGVDIVIVDSWVAPNHVEFTQSTDPDYGDADSSYVVKQTQTNNNSRVYALANTTSLWTTNSKASTHGTHVAGTAAGKTQGWCRDARVINLDFLNFATQNRNDTHLLNWHNFKNINNINRPTIVNHSWGYSYSDLPISHLIEISHRGTTYLSSDFPSFPTFNSSELYLDRLRRVYNEYLSFFLDKGLCFYEIDDTIDGCIFAPLPLVDIDNFGNPITDSIIEDHIDAGMIVCCAAGNEGWAIVDPASPDWNNTMYFTIPGGGSAQYQLKYNQGGSPNRISRTNNNSVIIVGALRSKNYKAHFSSCGSSITVYAPGEDIVSSVKPSAYNDSALYDEHETMDKLSGTSMASPQACGVLGLVAQKQINNGNPWPMNNSSAQASGVAYLSSSSYDNIYDSNIDTSGVLVVAGKPEIYDILFTGNTQSSMSLKSSPNRCLFFDAEILRCGETLAKPPCLWGECDIGDSSGSGGGSASGGDTGSGDDTGGGDGVFLPAPAISEPENQNHYINQIDKDIQEIMQNINNKTANPDIQEEQPDDNDNRWWWLK